MGCVHVVREHDHELRREYDNGLRNGGREQEIDDHDFEEDDLNVDCVDEDREREDNDQ